MRIDVDALKCIGCMACEMACGYHRDDAFALLASCIVVYRAREKKGLFWGSCKGRREPDNSRRPEGLEIKRIGVAEETGDSGQKKEADDPQNLCFCARPVTSVVA